MFEEDSVIQVETTRDMKDVSTYAPFLMLTTYVSLSLQLVHIPVYYLLLFV